MYSVFQGLKKFIVTIIFILMIVVFSITCIRTSVLSVKHSEIKYNSFGIRFGSIDYSVGENISKNPELFDRLLKEGHQIGNHTYNHIKGWKVNKASYIDSIEKCQDLTKTNLFRPPYGRIKKSQFKLLLKDYRVVFWDVLSYDYDSLITPKKCLDNSIKYTRNGSIIVFHYSIKAQKNLKFALPHYIEHFLKLNYKFATL